MPSSPVGRRWAERAADARLVMRHGGQQQAVARVPAVSAHAARSRHRRRAACAIEGHRHLGHGEDRAHGRAGRHGARRDAPIRPWLRVVRSARRWRRRRPRSPRSEQPAGRSAAAAARDTGKAAATGLPSGPTSRVAEGEVLDVQVAQHRGSRTGVSMRAVGAQRQGRGSPAGRPASRPPARRRRLTAVSAARAEPFHRSAALACAVLRMRSMQQQRAGAASASHAAALRRRRWPDAEERRALHGQFGRAQTPRARGQVAVPGVDAFGPAAAADPARQDGLAPAVAAGGDSLASAPRPRHMRPGRRAPVQLGQPGIAGEPVLGLLRSAASQISCSSWRRPSRISLSAHGRGHARPRRRVLAPNTDTPQLIAMPRDVRRDLMQPDGVARQGAGDGAFHHAGTDRRHRFSPKGITTGIAAERGDQLGLADRGGADPPPREVGEAREGPRQNITCAG